MSAPDQHTPFRSCARCVGSRRKLPVWRAAAAGRQSALMPVVPESGLLNPKAAVVQVTGLGAKEASLMPGLNGPSDTPDCPTLTSTAQTFVGDGRCAD